LVVAAHGRDRAVNGPLSQAALLAAGMPAPTSLADLLKTLASGQRGDSLWVELLTPEAAAAREQAESQLAALPSTDPFTEEPTVPLLDLPAGASAAAVARVESRLDKVVLGRLRDAVTVVGGP